MWRIEQIETNQWNIRFDAKSYTVHGYSQDWHIENDDTGANDWLATESIAKPSLIKKAMEYIVRDTKK